MYAFMTHCDVCLRVGEPLGGTVVTGGVTGGDPMGLVVVQPGAKPLILKPLAMTTESEVDPTQQPELAHLFRRRISCLIQSYLSY